MLPPIEVGMLARVELRPLEARAERGLRKTDPGLRSAIRRRSHTPVLTLEASQRWNERLDAVGSAARRR